MKIAFFEIEPWEKEILQKALSEHELFFFEEDLNLANVEKVSDVEALSVFIYSPITTGILEKLPNLRFISTRSTGFDHIDLGAAQKREITVCNIPYYGENTVAEHTFALILALSRKIPASIERTRQGNFSLEGLRGFDLKGKTLGVVGTGHIGRHVVRIAKGFEMEVLAFDVSKDQKFAEKLNFEYVPLENLLQKSDIITLHVPFNKHTRHLINKKNINFFKKGSYLINTARGEVVETEAILLGLEKEILAGAGLDVLEEEYLIKEERQLLSKNFTQKYDLRTALTNHVLLTYPTAVITPHNAFNSQEALRRILDTTIENIKLFVGGTPINVVE